MVEYASLDFGPYPHGAFYYRGRTPLDRWSGRIARDRETDGDRDARSIPEMNLGALAAIGSQKATQLFACLATHFDQTVAGSYEATFRAWGGDVRERSLDLANGEIRPREMTLSAPRSLNAPNSAEERNSPLAADPTVYARVDYLDPDAQLSSWEQESCLAVLKNLPVTFTFAPMNLLHYQVRFAAHSTRQVTVQYRQYAYADTRGTGSYQLAYVLHPATFWKEFGPIALNVLVPEGIPCRASASLQKTAGAVATRLIAEAKPARRPLASYTATLDRPEEKQGELFIAVDRAKWDAAYAKSNE
jgi:hypothetical protein